MNGTVEVKGSDVISLIFNPPIREPEASELARRLIDVGLNNMKDPADDGVLWQCKNPNNFTIPQIKAKMWAWGRSAL